MPIFKWDFTFSRIENWKANETVLWENKELEIFLFFVAKEKVKKSLDKSICPKKNKTKESILQVIPAVQDNSVRK